MSPSLGFRRSWLGGATARPSVELLLARTNELARERQELRAGGQRSDELEQNRLELVRAQWELSPASTAPRGHAVDCGDGPIWVLETAPAPVAAGA